MDDIVTGRVPSSHEQIYNNPGHFDIGSTVDLARLWVRTGAHVLCSLLVPVPVFPVR